MHGELSRALLRPQLTAPAVGRARFAFRRQVWYTDGMKRLHKKLDFPFRRALAVLLAAAMTFALAGCSVRELHIGQVEVNTGAGTAWITPARGVDRFDIPAADFSAGADGSVTYTGTAYRVLQGIDVSTFQQDIDWQAVADSGIAFAVIRAGYRGYGKGGIVEDDRFRQNVAGACAAGLRVGLYFFSQAVTPPSTATAGRGTMTTTLRSWETMPSG